MNELATYASFESEPWFAELTDAGRRTVRDRCAAIERIFKSRPRGKAIEREALRFGCAVSTVRSWITEFKRSGGNPKSQIDWRAEPHKEFSLPAEFDDFWKSLCEENQRSSKAAHRKLRELYWSNATEYRWQKSSDPVKLWPGYDERPVPSPSSRDGLPRGWSYPNLTRRENAATKIELTMARLGPGAASDLLEQVFTTRVGLRPGEFYVFDDRWLDVKAVMPHWIAKKPVRSIELSCGDIFSGKTVAWGLLPIIEDDDGRRQQLKERDMRLLLAQVLCLIGFYKGGVTLLVEHGTAAIPRELELYLCAASGGLVENGEIITPGLVRVKRSGIQGGKSFAGGFPTLGKGNFRFKAAWESMHSMKHNELADLPGQVGKNSRLEVVETDHGMDAEARFILAAASELGSDVASGLVTGYLPFSELWLANRRVIERIDNYTDHQLQGWQEAGLVTAEFRLTYEGDKWQPVSNLLKYEGTQRGAIQAFLDQTPWSVRSRQLSRREAWDRGKNDLVTLPLHCVPEILGPELAVVKAPGDDMTFIFQKKDEDDLVYRAYARRPDGTTERLVPGARYRTWVNPYDTSLLFVSHAQGGFIGICAERPRLDRRDEASFTRQAAEAATLQADVLAPYYQSMRN